MKKKFTKQAYQGPFAGLLTLILWLVSPFEALAQSYHNLASAGYHYSAPDFMPANATVETWFFRASLPLKLKNNNYLIVNPEVHKQRLVFDPWDSRECYKIGLAMAYRMQTSTGSIIALLNSSNNYERGNMSSRSMQLGAGVLATREYNKRFKLKYGLYCNRESFGLLIVPLLGVDYSINKKVRLYGILPQNMKLEYKAGKRFRTGLLFDTPLNTYMLKDNVTDLYLDQRQVNLGLFADIYLSSNLVVQFVAKHPISNSQRIFHKSQVYDANVLGIGIGGERRQNDQPVSAFRYNTILEMALHYRLEVD